MREEGILPGFTAEASLYRPHISYTTIGYNLPVDNSVYPSVYWYVDQACYSDCLGNNSKGSPCYDNKFSQCYEQYCPRGYTDCPPGYPLYNEAVQCAKDNSAYCPTGCADECIVIPPHPPLKCPPDCKPLKNGNCLCS
jgi:hypothetical protein